MATITTSRLRLDTLQPDDADAMVLVLADPGLYHFIGGAPPGLEELRARYRALAAGWSPDGRERWLNWIVRLRSTGEPIGTVQATVHDGGCRADVAWVIGAGWQGRGYAGEATVSLVAWLAGEGVREVRALIHPEHRASAAVAARAGLGPTEQVVDGEIVWSRVLAP